MKKIKEALIVLFYVACLIIGFAIGAFVIKADASLNYDIAARTVETEVKGYFEENMLIVDHISVTQDAGKMYRLFVRVRNVWGDTENIYAVFDITTGEGLRGWAAGFIDGQWTYEERSKDGMGKLDCIPFYQ